MKLPPAVVLNMHYSGLGIARSLGEMGVPVYGLTSVPTIYGRWTRYAKSVMCPDSRNEPERLATWLTDFGKQLGDRAVIYPTRDDDAVFLDRFREQLKPWFIPAIPDAPALHACLDKWQTWQAAMAAGVPSPTGRLIGNETDCRAAMAEIRFPCVMKPVAAHHWRGSSNWSMVGGRKAIVVDTPEKLLEEYLACARANPAALLQEFIAGDDECLVVAACYIDRDSNCLAAFTARKLVQIPRGCGTGCIVGSEHLPELVHTATRLLAAMKFSGIAEVEFKWDASAETYKLIEVNPRPWDQHRLGNACGVDLMRVAYRDYVGLPPEPVHADETHWKWIADDAFISEALRLLWRRDSAVLDLLKAARGRRCPAIWSWSDPLPFLALCATSLGPRLSRSGVAALRRAVGSGERRSRAAAGGA